MESFSSIDCRRLDFLFSTSTSCQNELTFTETFQSYWLFLLFQLLPVCNIHVWKCVHHSGLSQSTIPDTNSTYRSQYGMVQSYRYDEWHVPLIMWTKLIKRRINHFDVRVSRPLLMKKRSSLVQQQRKLRRCARWRWQWIWILMSLVVFSGSAVEQKTTLCKKNHTLRTPHNPWK